MANIDREPVTAGWPIPSELKEDFTDFCKHVGSLAKDGCAGALFAWRFLPAQIREWAILAAKGKSAVGDEFWSSFETALSRGIERNLTGWLTGFSSNPSLGSSCRDHDPEVLAEPGGAEEYPEHPIAVIRKYLNGLTPTAIELLSPDDRKRLDEFVKGHRPSDEELSRRTAEAALHDEAAPQRKRGGRATRSG